MTKASPSRLNLKIIGIGLLIFLGLFFIYPHFFKKESLFKNFISAKIINLSETGSIKGKITFSGKAPQPNKLDFSSDPFCASAPVQQQYDEAVIVNKNQTLKNVVVKILGIPQKNEKEDLSQEVIIHQKNCRYQPRVQVARYGQKVRVINQDKTVHHVHSKTKNQRTLISRSPIYKQWISDSSSPAALTKIFNPSDGEIVKLVCEIHPWMQAWLLLLDNPFYAVSNDRGEFEIKNIPVGEYTLQTFHEVYGEKKAIIKVKSHQNTQIHFEYSADDPANTIKIK